MDEMQLLHEFRSKVPPADEATRQRVYAYATRGPQRKFWDVLLGRAGHARTANRRRLVLLVAALAMAVVIVGVAVGAPSWLTGAPAPSSVKSDFGSYASQLGFTPDPGQSVLVASNGDYQLYATANKQGGLCTLVSAPWKRPGPNGEGGDCSATTPDSSALWAAIGGINSTSAHATTLVVYGHTTDASAANVQFPTPTGSNVTAPVSASGFFVAGMAVGSSMCDLGPWTPHFNVLTRDGQQLSSTGVALFAGSTKRSLPGGGEVCTASTTTSAGG